MKRIRAEVGLVFQDPDDQLFSPTVFEDVAFGPLHMGVPEVEIHERVERALAAVGMAGFERRLPHRLSLGQRKRVALATVLSMDPSILVFDEPSAGLDPRGRRELIQLLRSLDQTLLVSTHDMRLVAEVFPRTVVMDGGEIVGDGPTARAAGRRHLPGGARPRATLIGRAGSRPDLRRYGAGDATGRGMISFWPTRMRFGSLMLFASWIAATVTPYFVAMRDSWSPLLTT